jgi:hypothetical protein
MHRVSHLPKKTFIRELRTHHNTTKPACAASTLCGLLADLFESVGGETKLGARILEQGLVLRNQRCPNVGQDPTQIIGREGGKSSDSRNARNEFWYEAARTDVPSKGENIG